MSVFRVDLHIHSRFSRATSKRLNASHLAAWGRLKGLAVLGTGDFTHPVWRAELRENLREDEDSGLFRLEKPLDLTAELPEFLPPAGDTREPLFLLQAEISSIYKKDGAVRKVHNLVFMPDFDSAERLCRKLSAIGNLNADGRPILGLDSRHLLEMVLETDNRGVLIPAHIWTPWFSLFGSRSGFDTLEACFGDLSHHIFALETGLSSDPDMIRCWSALDRYALVSNSDCHSGENLGREANVFTGNPSYDGLFEALRRAARLMPPREDCRFRGTIEFFPEEGKYHLDGHRACNVVLEPEKTRRLNGLCPVCGKPLTVGVLHRVEALADRAEPAFAQEDTGFRSLIPLPELVGELLGTGSKSVKVRARYSELLARFGDELSLLMDVPETELRAHWDALGEAVARMRRGDVIRQGGYDGEYGVVRVFDDAEQRELHGGKVRKPRTPQLQAEEDGVEPAPRRKPRSAQPGFTQQGSLLPEIDLSSSPRRRARTEASTRPPKSPSPALPPQVMSVPQERTDAPLPDFSVPQAKAIKAGPGPVLVLAGPGSGKTRTLVGRIVRLLAHGFAPESIAAVTFTRRAAAELRERLTAILGNHPLPQTDTLHSLALRQWDNPPLLIGEEAAKAGFAAANPQLAAAALRTAWEQLNLARERLDNADATLTELCDLYTRWKAERNQADYTDLLEQWLISLREGRASRRWTHVLVDEIQDLSPLQLALVQCLLPPDGQGFFGIGDPDQAIYGFRGAHPDASAALARAWPSLEQFTLNDSHRSASGILDTANAVLINGACGRLQAVARRESVLHLFSAPDARKEANWIADRLTGLMGWGGHSELDRAEDESLPSGPCSPGDVAILVRTRALVPLLRQVLDHRGIPCVSPEAAPFWADPNAAALLGLAAARFAMPLHQVHLGRPLPDPLPVVPESYWQGDPLTLDPLLHAFPFLAGLAGTPALTALRAAWKTYAGWPGLLDVVRLGQDQDLLRAKAEQVQIMTLHASKGLEFRAVFLPALEDGLLPFFGADVLLGKTEEPQDSALIAEERRLLYVGVTRAAEAVFASHAEKRQLYGRELHLPASRFLHNLPDQFQRSRLKRQTQKAVKQMSLLG